MKDYKQIVWLASYPKSGNTWLRLLIEAYITESVDLNNIVTSVSDDTSTRYDAGVGSDVRTLPLQIQQLMRPVSLYRLVETYMSERPAEHFPLLVKTHAANLVTNGIAQIPPQLTKKVVHIVRDPRDVAVSFAKHLGEDIDDVIETMMGEHQTLLGSTDKAKCADFISSWKLHTQSYDQMDLCDKLTVRYEDMIDEPVETFTRVLEHIGIKVMQHKLTAALEKIDLKKLQKLEQEQGFIEASPKNKEGFFGNGGSKWREALKPYQVHRIEKMAGSYMEHFNYKGQRAA